MNFLKQGLVVLIAAFFMTACTQDDSDCTPPAVEQNIVGTWTLTGRVATVEFQTNGTLIDPSDDLIGGFTNNDTLDVKTYSISNDTLYTVAASSTTSNTLRGQYAIDKNECDKITLSVGVLPIIFTRQ
jgi:outer membrane receptor for monomeric catechols